MPNKRHSSRQRSVPLRFTITARPSEVSNTAEWATLSGGRCEAGDPDDGRWLRVEEEERIEEGRLDVLAVAGQGALYRRGTGAQDRRARRRHVATGKEGTGRIVTRERALCAAPGPGVQAAPSRARRASGPSEPQALIEQVTRRGRLGAARGRGEPSRSKAPGRRFSMSRSASSRGAEGVGARAACAGRARRSPCPVPAANRAGSARKGRPGRSTLVTSAPRSAKIVPASGAATYWPISTTRRPLSTCAWLPGGAAPADAQWPRVVPVPATGVDVARVSPSPTRSPGMRSPSTSAWQPEHALGNDVAHDLVRAPADGRRLRAEQLVRPAPAHSGSSPVRRWRACRPFRPPTRADSWTELGHGQLEQPRPPPSPPLALTRQVPREVPQDHLADAQLHQAIPQTGREPGRAAWPPPPNGREAALAPTPAAHVAQGLPLEGEHGASDPPAVVRSPTMLATSTRTSSKKTSLKCDSPVIWRSGNRHGHVVSPLVRVVFALYDCVVFGL